MLNNYVAQQIHREKTQKCTPANSHRRAVVEAIADYKASTQRHIRKVTRR